MDRHLRSDLDYIAIATPNVVSMSFEEMKAELADAVGRMNQRWADELESS